MNFVNLTNHDITIHNSNGSMMTIPPSGAIARLDYAGEYKYVTNGITIVHGSTIVDLPKPKYGIIYITSFMVAMLSKRLDVVCPIGERPWLKEINNDKEVFAVQLRSYA
jgi:hypothetical protein